MLALLYLNCARFTRVPVFYACPIVQYEDFDSWNNGAQNYKMLSQLDGLNEFLGELNDSIPHDQDSLPTIWDDQSAESQKFVHIILKDGSAIQLRLFKDGYVSYDAVPVFFKVDSTSFNKFWSEIE